MRWTANDNSYCIADLRTSKQLSHLCATTTNNMRHNVSYERRFCLGCEFYQPSLLGQRASVRVVDSQYKLSLHNNLVAQPLHHLIARVTCQSLQLHPSVQLSDSLHSPVAPYAQGVVDEPGITACACNTVYGSFPLTSVYLGGYEDCNPLGINTQIVCEVASMDSSGSVDCNCGKWISDNGPSAPGGPCSGFHAPTGYTFATATCTERYVLVIPFIFPLSSHAFESISRETES